MLTLISFLLFTIFVAVISWWKTHDDRQDTADGYFLAGRSLVWPVIGGSLLLTNLSTEQLVGINGGGYQHGMLLMTWEVWSSLSIVAMAIIFLPKYLKSGITTIPEFLEIRFDHRVRLLTSLISVILIVLILLPFILFSGAEFMIPVFGVEQYIGDNPSVNMLVVGSLLALIGGGYAVFGGLKAVAVSDTVNGIGLAVGGLLIPIFGLSYVGHGDMWQGLSTIVVQHPERMAPMGDSDANIPWHTLFTGVTLLTTCYWCTNQGIVQRTFAAKNLAEGQKGTLFAAVMKLFGPLYLVLPGIIAWHVVSSGDYDLANHPIPKDANGAYGFLVNLVLPDWATGFFAATIFGAILSSFNSFLNSGSTLFAIDIYQGMLKRNATDQEAVRAGRIFALLAVPLSVCLVLFFKSYGQAGLFDLLIQYVSVTNIPMISIMVVALISKRTPAIGASVALIAGMVFQVFFGILNDGNLGFTIAEKFYGWKMHGLHVAGINFAFLMLIMLAFRVLKPQAEPFEQKYSGDIDITPWKLAIPVGLGLIVAVAAIYLSMWSRFGLTPGAKVAAEYEARHPSPVPAK
ncbi:MAG: solute:sodium symporter family transporter [Planctomycetaceae bacterium]|nr:solute:sodium symporter family transporter [Planctomycetaceae bacterium]